MGRRHQCGRVHCSMTMMLFLRFLYVQGVASRCETDADTHLALCRCSGRRMAYTPGPKSSCSGAGSHDFSYSIAFRLFQILPGCTYVKTKTQHHGVWWVRSLTHSAMKKLAKFYNESFGVQGVDAIEARQDIFAQFIGGVRR